MADPALRLARFDDRMRRLESAHLIGVDEVGRGSLAGPVVAAAVILAPKARIPRLDDSKTLTADVRAELVLQVRASALAVAFAFVGPRGIENSDIRRASLRAMRMAILRLRVLGTRVLAAHEAVPVVLVDGLDTVPGIDLTQRAIIGGDGASLSIAAASVVAKTVRDGFMRRMAGDWPQYGFERNKGYGTPEHLESLRALGPCPLHRLTFAPVAQIELAFA